VIQSIRPYVSSQDIDKGARWSSDIAKELHESTFGILCVTRSNIDAPWINFEAGALSKTIDRSSVAPFLFDIKRSEVQGPLLQFQSTINEKEDLYKLLVSLNNAMTEAERLEDVPLKKSFDVWWPELAKALSAIAPSEERPRTPEKTGKLAHSEAILEEILDLTRSQQRLLRTPEELLPPSYLERSLRDSLRDTARLADAGRVVHQLRKEVSRAIESIDKLGGAEPAVVATEVKRMQHELSHSLSQFEFMFRELEGLAGYRRINPVMRRPVATLEKRKDDTPL
jgi:hypothetical protein